MSRHRNVRQMLDEYYEDDDYDDYDEYDDSIAPPPKKPVKQQAPPKKPPQNNKQQQQLQQKPQPKPQPVGKKGTAYVSPAVSSDPKITEKKTGSSATTSLSARSSVSSSGASSNVTGQTVLPQISSSPPIPPSLLNTQQKIPFTLVILGHVDAGKSTVTGHLLYAISNVMKKPENFAYLCDEDDQERSHGITMDIATKTLETNNFSFVLQDAPGHADYIPAMITGTSHADGALLVVDATDLATALYHGQLKEHIYVMRGMGVSQALVVVNKMDLVGWKVEVYQETCDKVSKFLRQVGFAEGKVRFVPVSGLTGANIAKSDPEHLGWYYNKEAGNVPLLAALDGFDPPPAIQARLSKPLRIVVTDVVGEQGRGVAVRAKVIQGWVQTGESLTVMPIGDSATIQKIASLQQSSTKYAAASEVLDCSLLGIDATRVSVGSIIARPGALPPLASKCRCKVWVLEGLTVPILRGTQAVFHISHLDVPCFVSQLIQVVVKNGGTRQRPKAISSNSQAEVELVLSNPIVMEPFVECRALGRFVLRRGGDSIAVGRIEQIIRIDQ